MKQTYLILFMILVTAYFDITKVNAQMTIDPVMEQLKAALNEAAASGDTKRVSDIMIQMSNRSKDNHARIHAERQARVNEHERKLEAEAAEKRRPAMEREEFHTFSKLIDQVMTRVGINPVQVGFEAAQNVTIEVIHDPIILQLIGTNATATKVALFEEHFSFVDSDGFRVFRDIKYESVVAMAKSILNRKYTIRVSGLSSMAQRSEKTTDEIYIYQIKLPVVIDTGDLRPGELESARASISWRTLVNQHEIKRNDFITRERPYSEGLPVLVYATGFAQNADAVYKKVNEINPYFVRPGQLDQLRRKEGRPPMYQTSNQDLVDQLKPRYLSDTVSEALDAMQEDFRAANQEMGLRLKSQERSIEEAVKELNQRLSAFYAEALDKITTASAAYNRNVDTVAQTLAERTFVSRTVFDAPTISEELFGFRLGSTFTEVRQAHIDVWNALLAAHPEYYQQYVLESGSHFLTLPFYEYHSSGLYSDYFAMEAPESRANNAYWDCEDDNLEITLRRNVTDVALFNHVEALRIHFYGQRLSTIRFRIKKDAPASSEQVIDVLKQRHTYTQSLADIWQEYDIPGMYAGVFDKGDMALAMNDQTILVKMHKGGSHYNGSVYITYLEAKDAYLGFSKRCKEEIDAKAADAVGDLF